MAEWTVLEWTLVSWNLYNLFRPNTTNRGSAPQSDAEYEARLAFVARTLNAIHARHTPLLVATQEIGAGALADLRQQLPWAEVALEIPAMQSIEPGLAVLSDFDGIAELRSLATLPSDGEETPAPIPMRGRPRAAVLEIGFTGTRTRIGLVVCHWKSHLPPANVAVQDRRVTADWCAEQILANPGLDLWILAGDLNCEPFSPELVGSQLGARRHRRGVITGRGLRMWNPMWRFLAEPGESAEGFLQPVTTQGDGAAWIIDQLLVSAPLLSVNSPARFDVDSIRLAWEDVPWRRVRGEIVPVPAEWSDGELRGGSDHFPILATMRLN